VNTIYPLKFKPLYKDYVWGGRNLEALGKLLPPDGVVAESWEVACHTNGSSIIANGEYEGITLSELIKQMGRKLIGESLPERAVERFPLLLKFIDAESDLSVQVHPDDEFAYANENGEYGKNEMWYIISAKPGAKLICDVLQGTTPESFAAAVKENSITSCLKTIEVSQGDIINIPTGTVHSIGKGIILAEIQQNSDISYRIYDYGRSNRKLHIDKALQVINFDSASRKDKYSGLELAISDRSKKKIAAANKYFCTEIYSVDGTVGEMADGSKFFIYMLISGEGSVAWDQSEMPVKSGETVMIPAALGKYTLTGQFTALKVYIPDLPADVFEPLRKAGIPDKMIRTEIAGISVFD
jgi:mannose-6-phosphate isomerase